MTRALALAFLVLGVALAAAQPAPQTAEQHYEQSKRYYAINEFDKAIAELKAAYTLSPDPIYLFNIAQAMRKKGDCIGAIEYYQKYLRGVPNAPNKAKVETWINELDACAKAQKPVDPTPIDTQPIDTQPEIKPKEPEAKPKTTGMVVKPPPVEPAPHKPTKSPLRLVGIVTAGVGGALAIGGTALAFNARSIQNNLEKDCNSMVGCNWEEERKKDQRGRDRALQSKILFGTGAAAIATGVVLYIVGRPSREAPVAIVPVDSGGMVVAGGRF